ncbi:hypothetical protein HPB50_025049 [Hyalomma asiaticum]|uniref:Uncharacterized protein n=1 Tax=Hyalomma asiaticum TaxID=266040 RepID=A0ACB7TE44_HYAAI|nr:hypothetical protein HPB50_025049 [Hyalomma asiaticum]
MMAAQDVAWLPVDVARDTCEHGLYPETASRRPWQRIVHTLVPTLSERPSATAACRIAVNEAHYLGLLLVNQRQELLEDEVLEANITSFVMDFAFPRYDLYLSKVFTQIYPRTPFDGLWLDRNEPTLATTSPPGGCPMDGWDVIPYTPRTLLSQGPLDARTLCMSQHLVLGPHLVAHNAVPYTQAQAAYTVLAKTSGVRPFVVSRSSYSGIGKYAGHVIHGLRPTWEDLRQSIPMLLTASLLGMPLSGAEVCGGEEFKMAYSEDEELCVTWFSLAVFYPLLQLSKAELFLLHPSPFSNAFLTETSEMLDIRLSLRPYLYYLFHRSHVAGELVMKPLFVEFPDDAEARNISDQFLWGSALMIIPFLQPNERIRRAHIPEGVWYDFEMDAGLPYPPLVSGTGGGSHTLRRRGTHHVLLLYRGGHVLPVSATPPALIRDGQSPEYSLRVALDEEYRAKGSVYCDDGVSAAAYYQAPRPFKRDTPITLAFSTWTSRASLLESLHGRADVVTQAEQGAIASAASHPTSRSILTVSRSAISQYVQGSIAPLAVCLLRAPSWRFNSHPIRITIVSACPETEAANTYLTRFRELLAYYCPSRRRYPNPALGSGEDGRTTTTPPPDERLPEPGGRQAISAGNKRPTCSTSQVLTHSYHLVDSCPVNPLPFSSHLPISTREAWEGYLLGSTKFDRFAFNPRHFRAGSYETGSYGLAEIVFHKDTLLVIPRHSEFPCGLVREVRIMGPPSQPPVLVTLDGLPVPHTVQHNQTVISNLGLPLNKTSMFVFQWKRRAHDSHARTDNGSAAGSSVIGSTIANDSAQAVVSTDYARSSKHRCRLSLSMNTSGSDECAQTK